VGGFIILMRERIVRAYGVRGILEMLALAGVYLLAGWGGLQFSRAHDVVSPVWPAAGVALVGLLSLGVSRWPGLFLGSCLVSLLAQVPPVAALGVATGNSLEAVLGVLLLRRLGFSTKLERLQDVVALTVGVALGATLISALLGTTSLALAGRVPWNALAKAAWVWWGADVLGIIVVVPALVMLQQLQLLERRVEAVALAAATLLVCMEVFLEGWVGPGAAYAETLFFFPLAVWAALRFGTHGTAFTSLLIAVLSIWGTVRGLGPFGREQSERALLLVQLVIAINVITGLLLAAVIAERRNAVKRLELFAAAVQGVDEGVVISEVTPQGPRVTFANEAFRTLVGLPPEELVGRSPRELLGEMDPETRQRLEATLSQSAPFRGQVLLKRQDGARVRSELQRSPMRDAQGQVTHLVSIHRDVTATEELRARMVAAERVATVGLLAAGVGHELNNPLSYLELSLAGVARGLGRGGAGMAEALTCLRGAQEGAERIRVIAQDLRMFIRDGGEDRKPVNLTTVVAPALRMTRHLLLNRARWVEQCAPVPAVLGSEARLVQVLVNLLVNAAQAIPEGAPERHEVRVRIDTAPDGRARLEVADTGGGIAPDVLPHLFEPFFTTKAQQEGTGLGLSICQQIVQAHRGEIHVQSAPDSGSIFTVLLPAASEDEAPLVSKGRSVQPSAALSVAARRGRILIVDDEPRLVQSMRLLLESSHDVVTTTRGSEALAMVSAGQRFDVVVCDLQMPETTGIDVYKRLREQVPELAQRLVFISGGAYTQAARDFIRSVSNRVLEKPVRPEVLLATIDAAMPPQAPSEVPQP
jgi:PAS domain S-box-containing protein